MASCRLSSLLSRRSLIVPLHIRSFSLANGKCSSAKVLTGETMNPFVKQIEYAVRGAIVERAGVLEKELLKVWSYIVFLGNFLRQEPMIVNNDSLMQLHA